MDCTLNNLTQCSMSLNGIKRIWLVPFRDIWGYEYNDLDFNKSLVTNYNLNSIPVEYVSDNRGGVFAESVELLNNNQRFKHSLEIPIIELDYTKRTEFQKLYNSKKQLTIVFKDNNNRCWIMGQHLPVRLSTIDSTTDVNGYTLKFEGFANEQIKQITCFDLECTINVSGREVFESFFIVENASSVDFTGYYEVLSNTNGIASTNSIIPISNLNPTNWTNPATYNADLATFNQLIINGNSNSQITYLAYDSIVDRILLLVHSTNTSYDYLTFNSSTGTVQTRALNGVTLNLQLTTGYQLNNSTVTVTDQASNVLYSGDLLDPVFDTGLSGIVGNAFINLSLLYPNGQTFTITFTGVLGNCSVNTYTYTSNPTGNCGMSVLGKIYTGRTYEVVVDKYGAEFFRHTKLYVNGIEIVVNLSTTSYNSFISQLQNDIVNAITNYKIVNPLLIPIDLSTITVTEQSSTWTIRFELEQTWNYEDFFDFKLTTYGDTNLTIVDNGLIANQSYFAKRSNLFNIETTAPNDSYISIADVGNVNTLGGQIFNVPNNNATFNLETIPSLITNKIEDIGFDGNNYTETDAFTILSDSTVCPNNSEELTPVNCYQGYDRTNTGLYYKLIYDAGGYNTTNIGKDFELVNDGITYSFSTPIDVDKDVKESYSEFTTALNQVPSIKVLSFGFEEVQQRFYLELIMLNPSNDVLDSLNVLVNTTVFAIDDIGAEMTYKVYPKVHPDTSIDYNFLTRDVSNPIFNNTVKAKDNITVYKRDSIKLLDRIYDSSSGTFDVYVNGTGFNLSGLVVTFYQFFPDAGVPLMVAYTIPTSSAYYSFNLDSTLISLGLSISNVNYITYKLNGTNLILTESFDNVSEDNVLKSVYNYINLQNIRGYGDYFKVITQDASHNIYINPVSTVCPTFPDGITELKLWVNPSRTTDDNLFFYDVSADDCIGVNGSFELTGVVSSGELQNGMLIRLYDTSSSTLGINSYVVTNILPGQVLLNTAINEPTGSGNYRIYAAKFSSLPDYSPYNRTLTASASNLPYFRLNQQNSLPTVYFYPNQYTTISPIMDSAPSSWFVFAVTKQSPLSLDGILLSHQDQPSEPMIQIGFTEYNGKPKLNTFDDLGNGLNVISGNMNDSNYNIYHWTHQNPDPNDIGNPNSLRIGAGINTDILDTASGTINNPILSGTETLAGYYTGTTYFDGFSGDLAELMVFSGITNTQQLQILDYLRTKYNL